MMEVNIVGSVMHASCLNGKWCYDRVYNLTDFKHTGVDEDNAVQLQSRLDKMFELAQEIQDNF